MSEPLLRFPVICPMCGREELALLPTAYVAAALLKGSLIQLYASCHDVYWDAKYPEVEQLRQYLGIAGINISTGDATTPSNATRTPDVPVEPSSANGKKLHTGEQFDAPG
ncbi:MAG: hypothetical protein M3O26_20940 [Pseudomonadota bacterium]|nr:hypothetical protein [Pseudomonadota bacterium]